MRKLSASWLTILDGKISTLIDISDIAIFRVQNKVKKFLIGGLTKAPKPYAFLLLSPYKNWCEETLTCRQVFRGLD